MTSVRTIGFRPAIALTATIGLALLAPSLAGAASTDSDRDGMPNSWEAKYKLNSRSKTDRNLDKDADGLSNWGEYRAGTDPTVGDTDNDNIGDAREDRDRDSLSNGGEIQASTDPAKADTDGDGIKDGNEDYDRDGVKNGDEDRSGSDLRKKDSDGDGVPDGQEGTSAVVSFDGTTLVVRSATGTTKTGTVDSSTEVECKQREDKGRGRGKASAADSGEDEGEGGSGTARADCLAALTAGVVLKEAKLKSGSTIWKEVKATLVPTG